MKSKCCNVEVMVNTSNEGTSCYVCRECKEACDIAEDVPRLTPEQWARVRWPDDRALTELYHTEHDGEPQGSYKRMMTKAIRYALQDLKPQGAE